MANGSSFRSRLGLSFSGIFFTLCLYTESLKYVRVCGKGRFCSNVRVHFRKYCMLGFYFSGGNIKKREFKDWGEIIAEGLWNWILNSSKFGICSKEILSNPGYKSKSVNLNTN